MKRGIPFLLVLLLAGCGWAEVELRERLVNDADEALARSFLEHVQSGEFDEANRMLTPRIFDSVTDSTWRSIRGSLGGLAVDSAELVGFSVHSSRGVRSGTLTFEGPVRNQWVQAAVSFEHLLVTGVQVQRAQQPLSDARAIDWSGASFGRALFLVVAGGILAFGLGTATFVWRSGIPGRRREGRHASNETRRDLHPESRP